MAAAQQRVLPFGTNPCCPSSIVSGTWRARERALSVESERFEKSTGALRAVSGVSGSVSGNEGDYRDRSSFARPFSCYARDLLSERGGSSSQQQQRV